MGVRAIARRLGVSRPTLMAWLKHEAYEEGRGWVKGTFRKYTSLARDRVIALKQARIDRQKYFLGSPHIQMDYAKRYPKEERPSLWFIDESVRSAGLQTHAPKKRAKGQNIIQRHRFPIQTIVGLGRVQNACNFIGKRSIVGSREPIVVVKAMTAQRLLSAAIVT